MIRKVQIAKKPKIKACKNCKQKFQPYTSLMVACSINCAIVIAKKVEEKKEEKEWQLRKKIGLLNLKTKSDFESDLEKEINHIVRLIDKGHECISSGAKVYQVNAGHLYSVGSHPGLRFNLLNIFNQSVGDNLYKGGNGVIYKERLVEVFGEEVSERIEGLKVKYPRLQLSIPELKEAIKLARESVRYLIKVTEDQEKPYSIEDRILLRDFYNDVLQIYK